MNKATKSLKHMRRANVPTFSGADPLAILRMLAEFVERAEALELGEAEAVELLPRFLEGSAKASLDTAKGTITASGLAFTWPYAVSHLLETYCSDEHLRVGVDDLHAIQQKPGEDENLLLARLHKAHGRLGNYLSSAKLSTIFVQALLPTIRPQVSSYRDDHRQATLDVLARKANSIGLALRAQQGKKPPSSSANTVTEDDAIPVLNLTTGPHAGTTDSTISTTWTEISTFSINLINEVLNMEPAGGGGFSTRKVPKIIRNPNPIYKAPGWQAPALAKTRRICWKCYSDGHIAPKCTVDFANKDHVHATIARFEALTRAEKLTVPWAIYARLKGWLADNLDDAVGPLVCPFVPVTEPSSPAPPSTPSVQHTPIKA